MSIKCSDGILLVVKRKKPSSIIISSTSNVNNINSNICIGYSGLFFDASVLLRLARQVAIDYKNNFNDDIKLLVLIEKLSVLFHSLTMKSKSRPLGIELVLLGYDDDVGYQVYTINPDGSYYSWNAIAIGGDNTDRITQTLMKYITTHTNDNEDNNNSNSIENLLKKINMINLFDDNNDSTSSSEVDVYTGTLDSNNKLQWKLRK